MTNLHDMLINVLNQSQKQQERKDQLIKQIFSIEIESDRKDVIISFFTLIGHRINNLSDKSVEVIMRLIRVLEMKVETDPSEQTSLEKIAENEEFQSRDEEWNNKISLILVQKLREAYAILGIDRDEVSPAEAAEKAQVINAYLKSEQLEVQKQIASPYRLGGDDI